MDLQDLIIDQTSSIEKNIQENTITIHAGDSQKRLSDIIKDFPDNCYVNKQITGCGGTTLVLRNNVNYVVLVPYINLMKSKKADNEGIVDLITVGGEKDQKAVQEKYEDLKHYLSDTSAPRKIVCTFDSLPKLFKTEGFNPKNFKLLVDEAHTLINLGSFKAATCEYVLQNYSKFGSYVFLTATPTKREYFPDLISHLPLCTIEWENVRPVKFNLQKLDKGTSVNSALFSLCLDYLLGRIDGNCYIFYNSVTEITNILSRLHNIMHKETKKPLFKREDFKIVCSTSGRNSTTLKSSLGKWGIIDDVNSPPAKICFLTSTCFEGADLYDTEGRTYIVINGMRDYTKLDFHVLVPQICGRLRNSKYNESVNLIISNVPEVASCTKEQWKSTVEQKIKESQDLLTDIKKSTISERSKKAILGAIQDDPYIFVDEKSEFYVSDVALKSELQSYEALEATYVVRDVEGVDHNASGFSASFRQLLKDESKHVEFSHPPKGLAKLLNGYSQCFAEAMEEYCQAKEESNNYIVDLMNSCNDLFEQYYNTLGKDTIKALRYRQKDISEAFEAKVATKDNKRSIQARLALKRGDFISSFDAKNTLHNIYQDLEINKVAKATHLFDWYDAKQTKIKGINGFVITNVK